MSERLLESILIQDGKIQNIAYHNLRLNKARKVFWPNSATLNLADFIEIPSQYAKGKVKCRVLYRADIELVEFVFYSPKKIERLKLVHSDMDYSFKRENRTVINELVAANPNYDDIVIVKNGLITDTSYANIILKKDNEFYTPKSPLLNGTKRQQLIDEEILIEKNIRPADLSKYSHFALINAMNDLNLTHFLPIKNIVK